MDVADRIKIAGMPSKLGENRLLFSQIEIFQYMIFYIPHKNVIYHLETFSDIQDHYGFFCFSHIADKFPYRD